MATDFSAQITSWYQAVQFRNPPASDLATYNAALQSGTLTQAQVQNLIINDPFTTNVVNVVIREYQAAFGRVPDRAGLDFWVDSIAANPALLNNLNVTFANSAEFQARFGANANTPANAALVATIYQQVYGRAPDAQGLQFWSTGFPKDAAGNPLPGAQPLTAAQLLQQFANAPEFVSLTSGAVIAYEQAAIAGTAPTTGSLFEVPNAGGGTGISITLSGNTDAPGAVSPAINTSGTTGDDTYNSATGTLQTGDVIDGKGGIDILKFVSVANETVVPTISNIETISVTGIAGAGNTSTVNLLTSSGYKTLETNGGANGVAFTSVGTIADARAANTTSGSLTINYQAATVAGTADTQKLALDNTLLTSGVVANTFTVNGIETLAITATGKNSITGTTAGISDAALKTVTVAGAGSLTIGGFDSTNLTSFDASAATGAQKVTFNTTTDVAVKGGSANDVFTFGTTFTSKDTVDAGGGTDTVSLVGGTYTAAANETLKGLNALTNVEVLEFTGTTATVLDQTTLTTAGLTKVVFQTTTNVTDTVTNANGTTVYAFGSTHDELADATITVKAGNTTLNLALEGKAQTATAAFDDANVDALNVTGALSVKLSSTGVNTTNNTFALATTAADFNNVGAVTNTAGATFTLTGDANTAIASFSAAVNVDASALTGLFRVTGSGGADFVKGGTNQNDITAGAGIDAIDISGSSKVDTINLRGILAEADRDTVTGFTAGAGGDLISVNAGDTTAGTLAGATVAIQNVTANAGVTNFLTGTNDVLGLNFVASGTGLAGDATGAALLAAVGTISVATDQDAGYIVAYQGGNAYLYYAAESNDAGTALAAADIHLVGTLNNVAVGSVTSANFVLA